MQAPGLIRLGTLAAVAAGALFVIVEVLYLIVGLGRTDFTGVPYLVQSLLFLLAAALLPAALIGLHVRQGEYAGVLGVAGLAVGFLGSVLAAGSSWYAAFVVPALARAEPALAESAPPLLVNVGDILSWGLLTVGWLLFGVAALRAGAYPRPAAILLIVGAVIVFLPLPFSAVPFGVALAWMGLGLLQRKDFPAGQSARVR